MRSLRAHLAEGEAILGDGALGTLLLAGGHAGRDRPLEALSLTHPDLLEEITGAYVAAGAEMVQTHTFQASPLRLRLAGLESETERINRRAVRAARRAARSSGAWVTGSVGPCGRMLLPFGDLDPSALTESLDAQLSALLAEGVDAVSIETMMDVEEACAAVRRARQVAPDVVVMASLVFQSTPSGYATPFGTPLPDAVDQLLSSGADVVGTNCGTGMADAVDLARSLCRVTSAPVLVRPNAGLPTTTDDGMPVWPETPEVFAAGAVRLRQEGVTVIGGCCGTTPDHVRAMRLALAGPAGG